MEEHLSELELKERRALQALKNMISAEKIFLRKLNLLIYDFPAFIKTANRKPVIPAQYLNKILGYLPSIRLFSENFLLILESRVDTWMLLPKLSDIIIDNGPYLKIFSIYTQNLTERYHFLEMFAYKYRKFATALSGFESSEICNRLTVRQYMLEPVVRLLQYKVSLQDYLQHASSIDYNNTREAIRILDNTIQDASEPSSSLEHIISDFQSYIHSHFRGVVSRFVEPLQEPDRKKI